MGNVAVLALRAVIALAFAGSLAVQLILVTLLWLDLTDAPGTVRVPLVVIVLLGIVTMQVTGVCIWRLLTMVRRGTVFSHAAFRYVDVVIGAIACASLLTFGIAAVAAHSNRTTPGDEVAPGVVALICGVALVVAGVALIVFVLRMLLVQAVALDSEARHLQSELDEVI
jgi:membrane protease YdiL (CAAX protease family)